MRQPEDLSSVTSPESDGASRRARAVWFANPRQVELRGEDLPTTGSGEVRVRTVVSALSHGTEMLVYRGQVHPEVELDLPTLRGSFHFPIKYGYASVGRVIETGAAVRSVHAGDLVFVHHPHQSEYVVPADLAIRLPENLPAEQGVFLANLETAMNVMLDAGIRLGERIAIFGQGVVGLLLTQLARRAGADLIVSVEPLPQRQELSRIVGADVVLAPGADVVEQIRSLTAGVGADVVLEASGSGTALQQAIDCAAFQGTVVVCSWYGAKPVTLQLGGTFHRRRLRLISSQVSTVDPALKPRWGRERRLEVARNLLASLQLAVLITHRHPFDQAADAYRLVDEHPEETVQVVLTYD